MARSELVLSFISGLKVKVSNSMAFLWEAWAWQREQPADNSSWAAFYFFP